jgi:hypothetical protein
MKISRKKNIVLKLSEEEKAGNEEQCEYLTKKIKNMLTLVNKLEKTTDKSIGVIIFVVRLDIVYFYNNIGNLFTNELNSNFKNISSTCFWLKFPNLQSSIIKFILTSFFI